MVTAAAARKRAAATVVVTAAGMMVGGGYSLARDADRARRVLRAEVCRGVVHVGHVWLGLRFEMR